MEEPDASLDRMWRGTCKVLFGADIGPYADYKKWLAELVDAPMRAKSAISGKTVIYSTSDYSNVKKSISLDEVDLNKKYAPLGINQLKDIESISAAMADRAYYAGNMVLGNSKYIQGSSNISDGFYISNTTMSGNSKYLAYCTLARLDSSCFGSNAFSQCEFVLKCHELTRVKRSFELWMSQDSSDCYYSHGLKNCTSCLFSFNLQNKRHCIGNLELAPEQYNPIKDALLGQLRDELKAKKRLPSLLEIVAKAGKKPSTPLAGIAATAPPPADKSKIEAAFAQTMNVILGKKPSRPLDAHAQWLVKHTHGLEKCKSAASGQDVFLAHYGNYGDLPHDRLLTLQEAQAFGKKAALTADEAKSISLANAHMRIGKIAFFNSDIQDGQNPNDLECTILIDAAFCYRGVCCVYSKYCAYSFWPRSCEYIFGCDTMFDSSFCVNCYRSVSLRRCLEMDSCNSCSDCYFCHNCENMSDSMFCFNVKNKKFAIGNVEVGRDAFMAAKRAVLGQLAGTLDKAGKSDFDILSM